MNTLHLQSGSVVERDDVDPDFLQVHHEGEVSLIAIATLRSLIAIGPVSVEPLTLQALLRRNIPIIYFDRAGKLLGRLHPAQEQTGRMLRLQATIRPELELELTKAFIKGHLRQARRFLQRKQRDYEGLTCESALKELKRAIAQIRTSKSIEELRGVQGWGLRAYYEAFPQFIRAGGWNFQGRSSSDPINLLLDLAYNLVEEECYQALLVEGLNPYLGILHTDHHGQKALASDLALEFRVAIADATVLRTINRRQLTPRDFQEPGELSPSLARQFLQLFERKLQEEFTHPFLEETCSYRGAIAIQAQQLAQALRQQGSYTFFDKK